MLIVLYRSWQTPLGSERNTLTPSNSAPAHIVGDKEGSQLFVKPGAGKAYILYSVYI